jgi:hypothetical protein
MINFTYLLGAGASANALPTIKGYNNNPGLSTSLANFVSDYNKHIQITPNPTTYQKKLVHILQEIAIKCIEFGTPDLYAKFLLETGDDNNYLKLKVLISEFIKYRESHNSFDKRALTFLTTITKNNKVPENIKILSWNYDNQIEIAAKKLRHIKRQDRVIDGFTNWPNNVSNYNLKDEQVPFLLHFNGVAGYNYSENTLYEERYSDFNFEIENKELLLSFAWEDMKVSNIKTFHNNRLKLVKAIAENTNILVIIGYSFPFFNREIDKEIFNSMNESLTKIYFQNLENEGGRLSQQFKINIPADNIISIKQTDNYHIPHEL